MRAILVLAALAACKSQDPPPARDDACAVVETRVREATRSQTDGVGSDAKAVIAQMLPAIREACTEDHWPPALVQCIVAAKPGDLAALGTCNAMMPKPIQDQLQQRMMKRRQP